MSEDKDANAFFSDGIHEDILTHLALIGELTVISRTSVMEYRGTTKKMREISEELGVEYLLEGSVRRAGNTVRVTGKLINARTDEQLWAHSFDRDLTAAGVFAIQSDLAKAIASALRAKLSPAEKGLLEKLPTENLAAYEYYLKGLQATSGTLAKRELFEKAVKLDPNFALAWAQLSWTHGIYYLNRYDQSPQRAEQAKIAIETAVRLAPDHPEVIRLLGRYYYGVFNDYPRALEQYDRVLRLQPNDAAVWHAIAAVHRRAGRWSEAIAHFRKAASLDPRSSLHRVSLASTLENGRHYEQAKAESARELAAGANSPRKIQLRLAELSFLASGSTTAMDTYLAEMTPEEATSLEGMATRKTWAWWRGDRAHYLELDRQSPPESFPTKFNVALMLAAHGDMSAARARLPDLAELRAQSEAEPLNADVWSRLALAQVLLGQGSEAIRHARRAMELYPESVDAYTGPRYRRTLAFVLAWSGDKDQAIAEYARLLQTPVSQQNVHIMRSAPEYAPLRGDPRFEALLKDPKNNAPLF